MTTYNTYQEAKVDNPECEIVTTGKGWDGRGDLIGKFEVFIRGGLGSHGIGWTSWVKCNPADHCMTMLAFSELGYKLVDGDVYQNEDGRVFTVGNLGYEARYCNSLSSYYLPSKTFILRAAALENQMNIDNLETHSDHQENMKAFKSNPVIQLSIDELDKFDSEPDSAFASINDDIDAAKWNGEGLPPVGAIYTTEPHFEIELLCKYSSEYVVVGEMLPKETYKGMEVVIDTMEQRGRTFRKPETPEAKEKRERLDAAYDLYLAWVGDANIDHAIEFSNWKDEPCYRDKWLRIVDKTNYRKGVK